MPIILPQLVTGKAFGIFQHHEADRLRHGIQHQGFEIEISPIRGEIQATPGERSNSNKISLELWIVHDKVFIFHPTSKSNLVFLTPHSGLDFLGQGQVQFCFGDRFYINPPSVQ